MKFTKTIRLCALIISAVAVLAVSACAACIGVGTVDVDALRLRSAPSTDSDVLLTASEGDTVIVIEQEGEWYKVNCNLKEGYMHSDYLIVDELSDTDLGYGKVNVSLLNFREEPSTESEIICGLNENAVVELAGLEDGWFKAVYNDEVGYISGEYISLTSAPGNNTFTVSGDASEKVQEILSYASSLLGCPYASGGTSPNGFDCSGFVYYVFKNNGITLTRNSVSQMSDGYSVSLSELRPGDLMFWADTSAPSSHVGIYIGNDQFIHSASGGVVITSINSQWYVDRYAGAVRVVE